jgi:hypothetical protein
MEKNKTLKIAVPLIFLLLVLVVYQYGYVRVRAELASVRESEAIKLKTLEKYNALIAEKPRLEKKLAALKEARKADDSKLIEGQTPSIVAAALQEGVKGILVGRGGTISSERVGKPEDLGNFRIINVSIDTLIPDTRALADILYSIETRTPYLIVKELDARVRNYQNPKELTVKLDVSALATGK